jgi:hypothetical protein
VKAKFQANCANATSVRDPLKPSTSTSGAPKPKASDPYKVGDKFKSTEHFGETLLKHIRDQGHEAIKVAQTGKANQRGVVPKYTYIKCKNKGGAEDKIPGTGKLFSEGYHHIFLNLLAGCKYAIHGKEVEKGEYAITLCDLQHNAPCIAKVALEAAEKSKAIAATPTPDADTSVESQGQQEEERQGEAAANVEVTEQGTKKKKGWKARHGKTSSQRRERDRLAALAAASNQNDASTSRQNDSDHVPDTPDAANSSGSEELPDISALRTQKSAAGKTVKRKVSMEPPVRKSSSKRMVVDSDAESSDGDIVTVSRTLSKPSKKARNEPTIVRRMLYQAMTK